MQSVEASIEVRADPEVVFDRVHDYDRRLEWDTFLQEARLLDGAGRAGLGVKTRCTARSGFAGLAMDTVYISFDRPRVAAVKMIQGPGILQNFAASIRQEEIRPGVTRVTYRFQFTTRPRWLRPLLNRLAAFLFLRETRKRLAALKRHIEKEQGARLDPPGAALETR
jgi:hypothetical protein